VKHIKDGIYIHNDIDLIIEILECGKYFSVNGEDRLPWFTLDYSIYGPFSNYTFPDNFTYIGEV
jgi:hypothetical protein